MTTDRSSSFIFTDFCNINFNLCNLNFSVWLDTRTKSTVDHFEATETEKTREHVRVSGL